MTLGPKHERFKVLLGLFIDYVCTGLEIDCEGLGSTTWKRSEQERGSRQIYVITSTREARGLRDG